MTMLRLLILPIALTISAQVAMADSKVVFYQRFVGQDGQTQGGQCTGAIHTSSAGLGSFTPEIRVDTDDRAGGCTQQFAIADPGHELDGLKLSMTWSVSPGGDGGQCGNQGERQIPISADGSTFSDPIIMDMDHRTGWCNQGWKIEGRGDIELDIIFFADDTGVDQCKNQARLPNPLIVTVGQTQTIGLDTDNRPGGCVLQYRLQKR